MPSRPWTFTISALVICLSLTQAARAVDSFVKDTSKVGDAEGAVVTSDRILELGTSPPSALRMEGEQAMRYNDIEKAITLLQKAVEMTPTDIDGRMLYAEALEKKLTRQEERDPALYNFVIKQWLNVAKKADYLDESVQAGKHLKNLTGIKPGRFEAPARYLARVLIPEDGSTKVAFGHKKPTKME